MNDIKCTGLGKVFGHSFKPVFETDIEHYNAVDKLALMQQEVYNNPLGAMIVRMDINYINPATQPKRVTKILKGFMCPKCGSFIKDNPINI